MTLPLSNAICERGFSVLNLIVTKLRNRLMYDTVDDLMRIYIEGESIEEFSFNEAYNYWNTIKKRYHKEYKLAKITKNIK